MGILKRVDLSHTEWLVHEYCSNDVEENAKYLNDPNFSTMTSEQYMSYVVLNARETRYYPGKYLRELFPIIARHTWSDTDDLPPLAVRKETAPTDARAFIDVLRRASHLPKNVRMLVFAVEPYNRNDGLFIRALENELRAGNVPANVAEVRTLDVTPLLNESMYFRLDDHLNAKGHAAIAEAICNIIRCNDH